MKNTMFYEEYEKFVWDFLSEYAVSKAYPENVKKELGKYRAMDVKASWENGDSPERTAWGLSLLV